ncbi:hypothetical protein CBFG_01862 [Clostridiales bacterium 1_7_47FAA]|nr:hypothetical protein CBFG_01862 [Clostridiales bacterium 1_7_47FAA]
MFLDARLSCHCCFHGSQGVIIYPPSWHLVRLLLLRYLILIGSVIIIRYFNLTGG